MTYRELMEYVKNNPGCLSSKEQQERESNHRFLIWLERRNKENEIQIIKPLTED